MDKLNEINPNERFYVYYGNFKPLISTKYFHSIDEAIRTYNEQYVNGKEFVALGYENKDASISSSDYVCFDYLHKHAGQFHILINDFKNHVDKPQIIPIKEYIESKINIRFQYTSKLFTPGCIIPYDKNYQSNIVSEELKQINEVYVSNRTCSIGWMTLKEIESSLEFDSFNLPIIHSVNVSYEVKRSHESGQKDIDVRDYLEYLERNKS